MNQSEPKQYRDMPAALVPEPVREVLDGGGGSLAAILCCFFSSAAGRILATARNRCRPTEPLTYSNDW